MLQVCQLLSGFPGRHDSSRLAVAALGLWLSALSLLAQPKAEIRRPETVDPVQAAAAGREMVDELLGQRPAGASTNTGVVRIRDAQDDERRVPVRFELAATSSNAISIYQVAAPQATNAPETLVIIHTPGRPNEYRLGLGSSARALAGNETMRPFAGSDFWVADLGLEFLHWPVQRVIKKEMRRGQFCDVLESVNPAPVAGVYRRVVSWIARNREGIVIVQASAYDAEDRLLKEFEPKNLERVRGEWQLQEMQMRNRQTGSRTRIEFDLGKQ